MTLHWWMHWFWITCHFTFCIFSHSMPTSPLSTVPGELETLPSRPLRSRPAKSIGQPTISKSQTSVTAFPDTSSTSNVSLSESVSPQLYRSKTPDKVLCFNYLTNITVANSSTSDSQNYTQFLCNKSDVTTQNVSNVNISEPVSTRVNRNTSTEVNLNNTESTTIESSNITKDMISNDTLTSVIVTKGFVSAKVSDTANVSVTPRLSAISITGISFGVIMFAAFIIVTSFMLYRRRYLNKPQTLNDKCSNPDSSGYIDDSTMRENSEEMYSLDNDSFLNSLEAMTIQNYWTDSVKHTKL